MSDPDPKSAAARIAGMIASAGDGAAPQPLFDEGSPDGAFDDVVERMPDDLDHDEMRKIDPEIIALCARQPQNDTGNGQRLLGHFGRELLHVRDIGWHVWTGTHWDAEGGDEKALRLAHRTAERIALEADYIVATPLEKKAIERADETADELDRLAKLADDDLSDNQRRRLRELKAVAVAAEFARDAVLKRQINRRKFAVSSGNSARLRGMLDQALPYCSAAASDLDSDPYRFNVENGTLVFARAPDPDAGASGESWQVTLEPHDPADRITKLAPVRYDAGAIAPRFDAFVSHFQPSADIRKFLRTYFGYCLTGLIDAQCLIFNYGLGSNGKSTLVIALEGVIGPYCVSLSFESLSMAAIGRRGDQATPDLVRLVGARMVRASEPKRDMRFDEALLKGMTGGEPMLVRKLGEGFFEYTPRCKLVLFGNHKPEIGGVDHGIWRRMRLVPWKVTVSDAERRDQSEVVEELLQERSGILNWLVAGALDYLNTGLPTPAEIAEATESYRDENDPLGGFIRDCIEIVAPEPGKEPVAVTARETYDAFVRWCEANSVRPWKETAFGRTMPQKGIERTRERIRRYLNIRLHDVPPPQHRGDDKPPHPADDASVTFE